MSGSGVGMSGGVHMSNGKWVCAGVGYVQGVDITTHGPQGWVPLDIVPQGRR